MTIQELKQRCIDSLNAEPKDPSEREIGYSIAMRHIIELLAQLPKQEISDEEILKAAMECRFEDFDISVGSFELGARWYREQLKSK